MSTVQAALWDEVNRQIDFHSDSDQYIYRIHHSQGNDKHNYCYLQLGAPPFLDVHQSQSYMSMKPLKAVKRSNQLSCSLRGAYDHEPRLVDRPESRLGVAPGSNPGV